MEYTATVLSSSVNLTKTIVGAGLLAIPFAYSKDGIFVGLLLTIIAATATAYGLSLLGKSSKMLDNPRTSSFFTLCSITYPQFTLVFDFAMFVQCFGCALSYLVLVGDVFPSVLGQDREFWIYSSLVIIVPLCLLKNLDSLRYSSMLGLLAIAYIVLFIIIRFFIAFPSLDFQDLGISWFKINSYSGMMSTFSILIFGFTASMNMFSICNELEHNSLKNIDKVIGNSVGVACFLFVVVGTTGYLSFGSDVKGNVILNYNPDSVFTKIGQFSLGSVIILSFPLLFHPLRIATNNMVFSIEQILGKKFAFFKNPMDAVTNTPDNEEQAPLIHRTVTQETTNSLRRQNTASSSLVLDATSFVQEAEAFQVPFTNFRFYIITALLLASLYMLGLNVQGFALVLSLVGATGSTSISFILPGLLGYKLFKNETNSKAIITGSIVCIALGFTVMFVSVFATLYFPQ
ncbi:hypothetical protein ACO0RG_001229 [Hanseniaspora osmophila]|uniref:Vacuolar amino acid transporter 7 n=1 Tax=Hanseniaspora osmophila TaxID=56408 RepID=A0A1E5RNJ8_9ASCO|nr:Vacuolar amino acid transporter 7 [Hanseniaspora osmophila]